MFQPNPPAPRAMTDSQLNSMIAELQLRPDGIVEAMTLIEEQSRLRQVDAMELAKWQLESQMQAATGTPTPGTSPFQDPAFYTSGDASGVINPFVKPAPVAPSQPAPEVDIFAGLTPAAVVPINLEPVALEPEISTPATTESASSQRVVDSQADQVAPAPAIERVEDIVAALNASYAAVATEPELAQAPTIETATSVADVELESQASNSELAAEPVAAPLATEISGEDKDFSSEQLESSEQREQSEKVTPTRTGFALSWSWLAVAGTPLALVLAAVIKDAGASLSQSIIVLASTLLLTSLLAAVGSLAAARGSNSLTVVSRAAFGVWGNLLPASVMFLAKLFWAGAFVYFATRLVSPLIFNQPWFGSLAERLVFPAEFTSALFVLVPLLAVAATISGLGGQSMLRLQQITAVVAVICIGAFGYFVVSSYSLLDLAPGESLDRSSVIDLGLFGLALFGLLIFSVAGDFARKLPAETPGSKVFFLSFVSTFFLPLATGLLGLLWLFMAGESLILIFSAEVLATVAGAAPVWVFVIFVVAIGLSLLQLMSASLYSLSGNLIGILRLPGWVASLLVSLLVVAAVVVPSYLVSVSVLQESIVELLLLAGVVAAAWAGLFVSDALIRTRGYHEVSLTREYGFYGRFNGVNVSGFLVSIALGFGYLNGGAQLSSWTGYLGDITPEIFEVAGSNIGIAMAFGLAALFPIVAGIPRIKSQEQNLSELDQRRQELKEFLDASQ